jgi:hypothetical protein
VTRSPFVFFFLNDPDRDIAATVGLISPLADWCAGAAPVSDGRRIIQTVGTEKTFHVLAKVSQGTMILYDRFAPDPCSLVGASVVARGTVNLTNNILVKSTGNLFSFRFVGNLALTSGGLAHAMGNGTFTTDAAGNLLAIHVDRFVLKPIGG